MKKIAKGVTLLLITLFLLMATNIICFAADDESTEGKIPQTTQTNFIINNSLGRDSVKIYVEDNILHIENQSSKTLGKTKIVMTTGDETADEVTEEILGNYTYLLQITNYFSEEYINGKDVNIEVTRFDSGDSYGILMVVILCLSFLILICYLLFSSPKNYH